MSVQYPLPADLPENWTENQIVSPGGTEVGLSAQHGYNYLMQQVNRAQEAANANAGNIAPVETTATASQAYAVNSFLVYNGQLYRVTAAITQGDALVVGTNIAAADAGTYLAMVAAANAVANGGVAPGGFGLGTTPKVLTNTDDLDNITDSGFYTWDATVPANAPSLVGGGAAYCCMTVNGPWQYVYCVNTKTFAVRYNYGTSRPWEYVNPPFPANDYSQEYRTTEKAFGKPVYVKRVAFATLEITGTTTIPHGISNMNRCVFIDGLMGGWGSALQYPVSAYAPVTGYTIDDTNIKVTTSNAQNPRASISFLLKYTKLTD